MIEQILSVFFGVWFFVYFVLVLGHNIGRLLATGRAAFTAITNKLFR